MRIQDLTFTVAVTGISRAMIARDRLLGRIGRTNAADSPHAKIARHAIPSNETILDAIFVEPRDAPARAALLICHGIGETVDHWLAAQVLLAAHGVASLVFDYSGYGRSAGAIDWRRCECNAASAYDFLVSLVPGVPFALLGFSMGSGIAAAIAHRVEPDRLFLCSAFTSFRDAACVLGVPRFMASSLPPIWSAKESLRQTCCPILVVHCQRDRAFPVRMASELAAICGANAELVVVADQTHNEAFYRPQLSFWDHILARLVPEEEARPA
jgi:hypothetical protein